jgi:hypothetical protein
MAAWEIKKMEIVNVELERMQEANQMLDSNNSFSAPSTDTLGYHTNQGTSNLCRND